MDDEGFTEYDMTEQYQIDEDDDDAQTDSREEPEPIEIISVSPGTVNI